MVARDDVLDSLSPSWFIGDYLSCYACMIGGKNLMIPYNYLMMVMNNSEIQVFLCYMWMNGTNDMYMHHGEYDILL